MAETWVNTSTTAPTHEEIMQAMREAEKLMKQRPAVPDVVLMTEATYKRLRATMEPMTGDEYVEPFGTDYAGRLYGLKIERYATMPEVYRRAGELIASGKRVWVTEDSQ